MVMTKDEIETPRTAAEMLAWVESALGRFNTRELKAAAREGKHFAKELTDEALPIALFAKHYYQGSADVTIRHVIGNQQYDAVVEDNRQKPSRVRYIESTVSDRDYTESLRMEILNRDRSVAAYGPVRAAGPRGRRTVLEASSATINPEEVREQHLAAIIEVIKKKADKKYPDDTALVVRIDDATPFREDGVDVLDEVARESVVPLLSGRGFAVLALVGSLGANLLYELP